eukprot:325849_1
MLLFKSMTFTEKQFIENMNYVFFKDINNNQQINTIAEGIKEFIQQFDVEKLHLNVKNNKTSKTINRSIRSQIKQLVEENKTESADLVEAIYKQVARCFIFNSDSFQDRDINITEHDMLSFYEPRDWICNYCGNNNFIKYIAGKINCDLKVCTLCNETAINSIILKIKNADTYTMINKSPEKKQSEPSDEMDQCIENVIKNEKISLMCPIKYDTSNCEHMVKLAKELIRYNKTLKIFYGINCGRAPLVRYLFQTPKLLLAS